MFWLHYTYYDGNGGGFQAWKRKPAGTAAAVLTILAGAFICIAGLYVSIKAIIDAYADGTIAEAFSC